MTAETFEPATPSQKCKGDYVAPLRLRRIVHLFGEKATGWARADLARLSLWAPVGISVGAGLYFGLKAEPAWQIGVAALIVSITLAFIFQSWRRPAFGVALIALGFVAADLRTTLVAAPQLWRDLGIVETTGRLLSVEEGNGQRRYIIAISSIEGVVPVELPAKARISWRGKGFNASPGDMISVRAGLSPPPPPAAPGTFDFARQLYFQRIGAVGFAVTPPTVLESADRTQSQKLAAAIERMRFGLFSRIIAAAPSEGGAILAAIVTGKRDAITDRSEAALRDTGLAHLLAISGLHMGLATGLIFFIVRFGLAAIEPIALRYPIKKWAAMAALASGFFYLILSGGGWSARRAFLMAGIMFVAILVDRRALSLRNVGIAAVIILLTTPEALFHPGFQMSFAAVTSLIAAYEWAGARADPNRSFTWPARLKRYAIGLAVTDTIAALATAPYALFHFNRVALYSLPANVTAMPFMGFWVVPLAIVAMLLMPLGLDGWAWRASAAGMDIILAIAAAVSSWPGAVSVAAQWPLGAMLALTIGGLWLCLSRAPWRLAGFAAIPTAMIIVHQTPQPDLFVSATGLNAGFVADQTGDQDAIVVYNKRREKFAVGVWKESVGFDPVTAETISMRDVFTCDGAGCVGMVKRAQISVVEERASLDEDCARSDLVIALLPVDPDLWRACAAYLIDRRSVWRNGAYAVRITPNGDLDIKTARDVRGRRPWTGDG